MGAIKSQELTGLKLVSPLENTSQSDPAKAIQILEAQKAAQQQGLYSGFPATPETANTCNPVLSNEGKQQAEVVLDNLKTVDSDKLPDGVKALVGEWSEASTPEEKDRITAQFNQIILSGQTVRQDDLITALGGTPAQPASTPASPALPAPAPTPQSPEARRDTTPLPPPPAAPQPEVKPAALGAEQPVTLDQVKKGEQLSENVFKLNEKLYLTSADGKAIEISKDALTPLMPDAKKSLVGVKGEEPHKLKDGESVDIALTTENKTFDDGDDGTFEKAIPTKILRVEKHGDELRYGVLELKNGNYVLTDKHSDVTPSTQFKNAQPLKYFHGKDGNIYNEGGKEKWLGPNPTTVGTDGGPTDVPQYSSLASVLNSLTEIDKQKQLRRAGKTAKERQEEDTLMAAVQMMGGQGGQASGGIGGGLGMQFGADSFGNFNVGVGVQGTNFGAGFQFGGGPNNGFGGGFGFPGFGNGGVVNLEEMLTVVFAILEQQERKRIVGYLKDMYAKSSKMNAVTGDQVKDKPGILNSMNIETSISQAFLQNSMGKRQNMLETLYGIIRNTHESKRRSIQNLA